MFLNSEFILEPRSSSEQRSVRVSQFENPRFLKLSQVNPLALELDI